MKPADFVVFDGGSSPNTPIYEVAEAMIKDIKILAINGEYEVLSYYFDEDEKCMILDIQYKE